MGRAGCDFAGNGKLSHDRTMERIGWRVTPAVISGEMAVAGLRVQSSGAPFALFSSYLPAHFPPGQRLFSSQTYSKIPC
jgi:hypothetical protein